MANAVMTNIDIIKKGFNDDKVYFIPYHGFLSVKEKPIYIQIISRDIRNVGELNG